MRGSLVQPLFAGPLDIVGDIHGEIDALRNVLACLGYREDGVHPDRRRLVFLGDLTDRGPNSPAVVELAARLVREGNAQCIMGNHELNILLEKRKLGNGWFYGETESLSESGPVTPQKLADEATKECIKSFFRSLPLALQRDDLRLVHACWQTDMVAVACVSTEAKPLHDEYHDAIERRLNCGGVTDKDEMDMAYQNQNPVKLLTSGPEKRADHPFEAGGKRRRLARVPWWRNCDDRVFCIFGHYGRLPVQSEDGAEHLFDGCSIDATLGNGYAMCIDYGMAERWKERLKDGGGGTRLGVLRFPEKELVFDNGERLQIKDGGH